VEGLCQGKRSGAATTTLPIYTDTLHLDMGEIVPAYLRPETPAGLRALTVAKDAFNMGNGPETFQAPQWASRSRLLAKTNDGNRGKVVIASITSLHQHLQHLT